MVTRVLIKIESLPTLWKNINLKMEHYSISEHGFPQINHRIKIKENGDMGIDKDWNFTYFMKKYQLKNGAFLKKAKP